MSCSPDLLTVEYQIIFLQIAYIFHLIPDKDTSKIDTSKIVRNGLFELESRS